MDENRKLSTEIWEKNKNKRKNDEVMKSEGLW
jgi:hypothetical protein